MMFSHQTFGTIVSRQCARVCCGASCVSLAAIIAANPLPGQAAKSGAAMPEETAELPHPFFTHMGLPEGVGNFNLRTMGLTTGVGGQNKGDFAFHLETGLTRLIGMHVRNDRFLDNQKSEIMFQFGAFVSKNGMNGLAPIIEFEIPTKAGASRVNTLVGFTSSLGGTRWAFNQVFHYDPREDMFDASAALVVGASRSIFPVVELFHEGGTGRLGAVAALAGVKFRVQEWLTVGVAYRIPITTARDFSRQYLFGPDLEWKVR